MLRTVAEAAPLTSSHASSTSTSSSLWSGVSPEAAIVASSLASRSAAARLAEWPGNAAARQCPPSRWPDAGDVGRGSLRVDRTAADGAPADRQLQYSPCGGPGQPCGTVAQWGAGCGVYSCPVPPWQHWWPTASSRHSPASARRHGAISRSSITGTRCGSVTSPASSPG